MATITLRDNRLFIDKEAVKLLAIAPDDRIEVRYWNEGDTTFPIIGKIEAFGDCEGRRVTKKYTVSFRGQQAQVLQIYGTDFTLSTMEGKSFFKMTAFTPSTEEQSLKEAEDDLNNIEEFTRTSEFIW